MSWHVTTYYCTTCGFRTSDTGSWGLKEYVLSTGVRLTIDWRLGWCHDCKSVRAVELLDLQIAEEVLRQIQSELAASTFNPKKWWCHLFKLIPNLWRFNLEHWQSSKDAYDDALDIVELIRNRQAARKCLSCGGTHVVAPLVTNAEATLENGGFAKTGFVHPECGGDMYMTEEGVRLAIKPVARRYTTEGEFIDDEALSGYSGPERQYYEDRQQHNRAKRVSFGR